MVSYQVCLLLCFAMFCPFHLIIELDNNDVVNKRDDHHRRGPGLSKSSDFFRSQSSVL